MVLCPSDPGNAKGNVMTAQDARRPSAIVRLYLLLTRWGGPVVLSLVLLLFRVVFGYAFFQAGSGKLRDISKPISFFRELGIPAPVANAWLVSIVECVGGLLVIAGLGARATAVALSINMIVAYLTAHRDSVVALFSKGDVPTFVDQAPFWFLVTSLLVLALGPGMISMDALLKRFVFCDTSRHDGSSRDLR
jgi:putative oxidoreductase